MRIGILTSGGDTPGMNAVIWAVQKRAAQFGFETIGFRDGWKGLMENDSIPLSSDQTKNILSLGGTILGSSRTNPFKRENGLEKIKATLKEARIDALIAIGGDDTLGVARKLHDEGIPIVGVPKTIDNDLDATDYTFGFNTAVTIATEALDRLATTAKSHHRTIVVEIMGRHAGWITLYSGIAGGAHVILLPELSIPMEKVAQLVKDRYTAGETWALVAVSEGYEFVEENPEDVSETDEFGHVRLEKRGVAQRVADYISSHAGVETRHVVLGHTQRGGPPTAYDRVLSVRFGIHAVELIKNKKFGHFPALKGTQIVHLPLKDAVDRLKLVDEHHLRLAKIIMGLES